MPCRKLDPHSLRAPDPSTGQKCWFLLGHLLSLEKGQQRFTANLEGGHTDRSLFRNKCRILPGPQNTRMMETSGKALCRHTAGSSNARMERGWLAGLRLPSVQGIQQESLGGRACSRARAWSQRASLSPEPHGHSLYSGCVRGSRRVCSESIRETAGWAIRKVYTEDVTSAFLGGTHC